MASPVPASIKPARPGDICILLEPGDPAEINALLQRQLELQQHYGGQVMEPVHVTCQRFVLANPEQYPALVAQLSSLAASYQHFEVSAQGLVPLYSDYRQVHILKWEILREAGLVSFSAQLEHVLEAIGFTSLYPPGWVSKLVTALEDISAPDRDEPRLFEEPYKLFTPRILTLSRIHGPSEFEILDQIRL